MMSYNGLSDLHIIPKGQSLNALYYIEEILSKTMLSALQRDGEIGGVSERKLLPDMLQRFFSKMVPQHIRPKKLKIGSKQTSPTSGPKVFGPPIHLIWAQ